MDESEQQAKQAVQRAYENWSSSYDSQENPTRDLSSALARRFFPEGRPALVVEAGCGTGLNTGWLAARCEKLIAFDFSVSMMAIAREKVTATNVAWHQRDIMEAWPVPAGQADVVLINLVIEHIADLETILGHASNALAPGGQLIITEYHPDRVQQGKGAEIENEAGEVILEIHNHHHPASEYVELANKLELKVINNSGWQADASGGTPYETDQAPLILLIILKKGG